MDQQLRTYGVAWLRCLHGRLRACRQRRNEALDDQPRSKQDDRVPASKLEQCQGDSVRQVQSFLLCKRCAVEFILFTRLSKFTCVKCFRVFQCSYCLNAMLT